MADRVYHWKHGWIPLDAYAAAQKHGTKEGGGSLLSADQYESMRPEGSWSEEKRKKILDTLGSTPEGKVLADTLDRFQDGGSIARLRTKIEQRLRGEPVDETSRKRVDVLLGAIRDAPDWSPDVLYRGMSTPGSQATVLSRYNVGDSIDLSLTSFSSDRSVAKRDQMMTAKDGKKSTRVTVELVGSGKKTLPIQNLPHDRRLFKEKEWVTAGRFKVLEAKKSPDGGVIVRVQQQMAL
jgi:hypothetical protein